MSTPHGPARRGPDESDERVLRSYRAASDALAEQPAAAARGAILAAAAREVQAAPRSAETPLGAPSPAGRTASRATAPTRWPLAAAAAVLLSTLAVMLASRTAQEQPSFTAAEPVVSQDAGGKPGGNSGVNSGKESIARTDRAVAGSVGGAVGSSAEDSVAAAARSAGAPGPSTATAGTAPGTASPAARQAAPAVARPSVPDAPSAEVAHAAPPTASSVAQQQPAPPARTNEARVAMADASSPRTQTRAELAAPAMPPVAAPSAPSAASAATPTAPALLAKQESALAAPAAESVAASNAGPKLQSTERRRDMDTARDATTAANPPSVAATTAGAVRSEADATAANAPGPWLDRIVALRRAGQHDEADRELKRLRERYPQLEIPAAALPPVGTR